MTKDQVEIEIKNAVVESSKSRLESFCKVEGVALKKDIEIVDGAQYRDMVLILLSGSEIHLILKMFFDSEAQGSLISKTYGQLEDRTKVSKYAVDTIKEVANLVAGHMKLLLETSKLDCEISLPIAMRGYDDLFFRDRGLEKSFRWNWELRHNNEPILLSGQMRLTIDREVDFQYVDQSSSLEIF